MKIPLGKWKLNKNIEFDSFLEFNSFSWARRQIALHSNIDLLLEQNNTGYSKTINSLFFNAHEDIIMDGNFRMYDGINKKYLFENDNIIVDIIGNKIVWKEIISYNQSILTVEYIWMENSKIQNAKQEFIQ